MLATTTTSLSKKKPVKKTVRLKAIFTKKISGLCYYDIEYLILFLKHDALVHISN